MLPKNRRISRKLFPFILKEGKRFNSEHFLLYLAKTEQNMPSRFSFSVSKKIFKRAVLRNKFHRRGYSIVSKHIKDAKSGYLLFFSYKKTSNVAKFSDLELEIVSLLRQAGVLS